MASSVIGERLQDPEELKKERELLVECLAEGLKVTYTPHDGREDVLIEYWLDRVQLFGVTTPSQFQLGRGENLSLALYSFLLYNPNFGVESEFRAKHFAPEIAATCTHNQGVGWDDNEEGKPLRCACCGQ